MRIMGLDVGEKRIGIAISDQMGWTAQGHSVISRRSWKSDFNVLFEICQEYKVTKIIIGLPLNMNGSIGPKAIEVQDFGSKLGRYTTSKSSELTIEYWDERLTTMEAERILIEADVSRRKRKKVIDKMAAVNILQSYLDSKSGS